MLHLPPAVGFTCECFAHPSPCHRQSSPSQRKILKHFKCAPDQLASVAAALSPPPPLHRSHSHHRASGPQGVLPLGHATDGCFVLQCLTTRDPFLRKAACPAQCGLLHHTITSLLPHLVESTARNSLLERSSCPTSRSLLSPALMTRCLTAHWPTGATSNCIFPSASQPLWLHIGAHLCPLVSCFQPCQPACAYQLVQQVSMVLIVLLSANSVLRLRCSCTLQAHSNCSHDKTFIHEAAQRVSQEQLPCDMSQARLCFLLSRKEEEDDDDDDHALQENICQLHHALHPNWKTKSTHPVTLTAAHGLVPAVCPKPQPRGGPVFGSFSTFIDTHIVAAAKP